MTKSKEKDIIELEHDCKMEQLEYIRETERLKHEWDKERQRIKSAEIRKTFERKANKSFSEEYHRGR